MNGITVASRATLGIEASSSSRLRPSSLHRLPWLPVSACGHSIVLLVRRGVGSAGIVENASKTLEFGSHCTSPNIWFSFLCSGKMTDITYLLMTTTGKLQRKVMCSPNKCEFLHCSQGLVTYSQPRSQLRTTHLAIFRAPNFYQNSLL